jgi:hypothetical protein
LTSEGSGPFARDSLRIGFSNEAWRDFMTSSSLVMVSRIGRLSFDSAHKCMVLMEVTKEIKMKDFMAKKYLFT